MFFLLSKTLDLLVAPLTWALFFLLASLWAIHRGQREPALRRLLASLAVLILFSSPPLADALTSWMESSAVTTMPPSATYDVVVVLGGLVSSASTPEVPDFNEQVDRLLAGYDVLRHDRAKFILLTSDPDEVAALSHQLSDWGVAPDRIVTESHSRNTHDNAAQSAKIIRSRGWQRVLLVTSALHMPRAAGCFRAEGLIFDTLAVDRLAPAPGRPTDSFAPRAEALRLATLALREGFGRLVYRAVGYSR